MSDLISRSALLRGIESINPKYGNENSSLVEQGEVLVLIAEAPTVEAIEVVHGRWINKQGGFWETAECSICGAHSPTVGGGMYFCTNCGAKMDGGSDETN